MLDRILLRVVETRCADGGSRGFEGLPQLLDERVVPTRIEGKCGTPAKYRFLGVGHLRQLLPRQMVPIQRDSDRDVRLAGVGVVGIDLGEVRRAGVSFIVVDGVEG